MAEGDILWETGLDGSDVSGAVCIFLNDDIFTVTGNQNLFRVDTDGNVKWQANVGPGGSDINAGGVLTEAGTYITGTTDSDVRAFDFDDGSEIWRTTVNGDPEDSAPALGGNGDIYISNTDGLSRIDISDGSIIDEDTTFVNDSAPAILPSEDVVIAGSQLNGIRSYSPSLNEQWTTGMDTVDASHTSIDQNGFIYQAAAASATLYKLSSSGSVQWQANLQYSGSDFFHTSVHDAEDRVYVYEFSSGSDVAVEGFTLSGNHVFTITDTSFPDSSGSQAVPIPVRGGGFIVNWENGLAKFDKEGNQIWFSQLASGWVRSAPALSEAGFAAVGGPDGNLHKVEIGNLPAYTLADANARPWDYSKFRNNSGQFEGSSQCLLWTEQEVGLRGGNPTQGDQTVLYTPELGREGQNENTGQDVLLSRDELGQG